MHKPLFRRPLFNTRRYRAPGQPHIKRSKFGAFIKIAAVLTAICILILILFDIAIKKARPIIELLALAEARRFVITAVNDAISDEITSGKISYDSLVTIERADDGTVSALVTDMAKINMLQASVSNRVARQVVNLINTDLVIHLGDVTNNMMLTGHGPRLPVRVQSIASVETAAKNDFSDSGVNQTHHRISLIVSVEISIILPGGPAKSVVTTEVAIAESIIVGKVPGIYGR